MISQAQKIDYRVFVGEKYFHFFLNRLFQQNQLTRVRNGARERYRAVQSWSWIVLLNVVLAQSLTRWQEMKT